MGYLDKFRILEKTTYTNKKKYVPQVVVYVQTIRTGMLWWKKETKFDVWNGFMYNPDNTLMFDHRNEGVVFNTIEEAKEAIEKFIVDMKATLGELPRP